MDKRRIEQYKNRLLEKQEELRHLVVKSEQRRAGGRRSGHSGYCRQSGQFLREGVPFSPERRPAANSATRRRGSPANRKGGFRVVRRLRKGRAEETPESRSVGPPLYRLPGETGAGPSLIRHSSRSPHSPDSFPEQYRSSGKRRKASAPCCFPAPAWFVVNLWSESAGCRCAVSAGPV